LAVSLARPKRTSEHATKTKSLSIDFLEVDIRVGTISKQSLTQRRGKPSIKMKMILVNANWHPDHQLESRSTTPQMLVGRKVMAVVNSPQQIWQIHV